MFYPRKKENKGYFDLDTLVDIFNKADHPVSKDLILDLLNTKKQCTSVTNIESVLEVVNDTKFAMLFDYCMINQSTDAYWQVGFRQRIKLSDNSGYYMSYLDTPAMQASVIDPDALESIAIGTIHNWVIDGDYIYIWGIMPKYKHFIQYALDNASPDLCLFTINNDEDSHLHNWNYIYNNAYIAADYENTVPYTYRDGTMFDRSRVILPESEIYLLMVDDVNNLSKEDFQYFFNILIKPLTSMEEIPYALDNIVTRLSE